MLFFPSPTVNLARQAQVDNEHQQYAWNRSGEVTSLTNLVPLSWELVALRAEERRTTSIGLGFQLKARNTLQSRPLNRVT